MQHREEGCGLARGVEDKGVVEEREGDAVEGTADEERRHAGPRILRRGISLVSRGAGMWGRRCNDGVGKDALEELFGECGEGGHCRLRMWMVVGGR
jgi:hypothetical protein